MWVIQTANIVATIIIICYSTPIFIAVLIPLVIIFVVMQVCVTTLDCIDNCQCPLFRHSNFHINDFLGWQDGTAWKWKTEQLESESCIKFSYNTALKYQLSTTHFLFCTIGTHWEFELNNRNQWIYSRFRNLRYPWSSQGIELQIID